MHSLSILLQPSGLLSFWLFLLSSGEAIGQESYEVDLVEVEGANRQLEVAERINFWGTVFELLSFGTTQHGIPVGQINEGMQIVGGADVPGGAERATNISRARTQARDALEDVNRQYNRIVGGYSTRSISSGKQTAPQALTERAPSPVTRVMSDGSVREYERVIVLDFEGRERVMITDRYSVVDRGVKTNATIENEPIIDVQAYQLNSRSNSTTGHTSQRTVGSGALSKEAQEALDKYIGGACAHAERHGRVAMDGLLVRDLNADGMEDIILYHDKIVCDDPRPQSNTCISGDKCYIMILWPNISSYTGEPEFTGWKTFRGGDIEVGTESPPVLTYRNESGYFTMQWNGTYFEEAQWRPHGE